MSQDGRGFGERCPAVDSTLPAEHNVTVKYNEAFYPAKGYQLSGNNLFARIMLLLQHFAFFDPYHKNIADDYNPYSNNH